MHNMQFFYFFPFLSFSLCNMYIMPCKIHLNYFDFVKAFTIKCIKIHCIPINGMKITYICKEDIIMKEKVVLAYSGGLDTTA